MLATTTIKQAKPQQQQQQQQASLHGVLQSFCHENALILAPTDHHPAVLAALATLHSPPCLVLCYDEEHIQSLYQSLMALFADDNVILCPTRLHMYSHHSPCCIVLSTISEMRAKYPDTSFYKAAPLFSSLVFMNTQCMSPFAGMALPLAQRVFVLSSETGCDVAEVQPASVRVGAYRTVLVSYTESLTQQEISTQQNEQEQGLTQNVSSSIESNPLSPLTSALSCSSASSAGYSASFLPSVAPVPPLDPKILRAAPLASFPVSSVVVLPNTSSADCVNLPVQDFPPSLVSDPKSVSDTQSWPESHPNDTFESASELKADCSDVVASLLDPSFTDTVSSNPKFFSHPESQLGRPILPVSFLISPPEIHTLSNAPWGAPTADERNLSLDKKLSALMTRVLNDEATPFCSKLVSCIIHMEASLKQERQTLSEIPLHSELPMEAWVLWANSHQFSYMIPWYCALRLLVQSFETADWAVISLLLHAGYDRKNVTKGAWNIPKNEQHDGIIEAMKTFWSVAPHNLKLLNGLRKKYLKLLMTGYDLADKHTGKHSESRRNRQQVIVVVDLPPMADAVLYHLKSLREVEIDKSVIMAIHKPAESVSWGIQTSDNEVKKRINDFKAGDINMLIVSLLFFKDNNSRITSNNIKVIRLCTNVWPEDEIMRKPAGPSRVPLPSPTSSHIALTSNTDHSYSSLSIQNNEAGTTDITKHNDENYRCEDEKKKRNLKSTGQPETQPNSLVSGLAQELNNLEMNDKQKKDCLVNNEYNPDKTDTILAGEGKKARKLIPPRTKIGPEMLEEAEDGIQLNAEAKRALQHILRIPKTSPPKAKTRPNQTRTSTPVIINRSKLHQPPLRRIGASRSTTAENNYRKYNPSDKLNNRQTLRNPRRPPPQAEKITGEPMRKKNEAELKDWGLSEILNKHGASNSRTCLLMFASSVGATVDVKHSVNEELGKAQHLASITFSSNVCKLHVSERTSSPIDSEDLAAEKMMAQLISISYENKP